MPKYRLRTEHFIRGRLLPAGTEIGEGTGIRYDERPSNRMEGVDEAGVAEVNKLHKELYDRDAPWHSKEAMEAKKRSDEEMQRQREEEREDREAREQRERERRPVVTATATASPTRSGQTATGPGIPAPRPEPQPVTKPNKEQSPKDN